MTCIIGLKDGKTGKLYLGGDSQTTSGFIKRIRRDPKVYRKGELLLGGAGASVINQALARIASNPPVVEGQEPLIYILNEFIPSFKDTLRSLGQLKTRDGIETTPNDFIAGFRGKLFEIGCDFNVFESADNYLAIGSGSEVALGSLYTTEGADFEPETRIIIALNAAREISVGVGGPIDVISEDGEVTQCFEDGEIVKYSADGKEIKEEIKEGKKDG